MTDITALKAELKAERQTRKALEILLDAKTRELQRSSIELQESTEALWNNSSRLSTIMDNVPAAILTIDAEGKIENCNRVVEATTGFGETELVGQKFGLLFDLPQTKEAVSEKRDQETMGRRKDGTSYPCEYSIALMEKTVNEANCYILFAFDITARKEAERNRESEKHQAHQTQKLEALGTLSGGVAHEINTPVQYLGDNLRFLREAFKDLTAVQDTFRSLREAAESENILSDARATADRACADADLDFLMTEVPKSIEQTLEGVERIAEIVRAIKQFSHPDAEEMVPVDLNEAINTTLIVSRNQWKYIAEVETDLDPNLPTFLGLPGQINQVLLNLIVNAAHAIEDRKDGTPGRIVIATGHDGPWAELLVSDNGVGIRPENKDKIFEPFFTTKEPGRGTGQGMAIVHTIVTKRHGGQIQFISEPGKGATFVVRFAMPATQDLKAAS